MLRSGRSIRFTAEEVALHREPGIDLHGVKSPEDYADALEPWLHALAEVRPDLLDLLGEELRARGVQLPPQLTVVSSGNSGGRS